MWRLLLAGCVACGRLGFDATTPGSDAPIDTPSATCWPAWQSGAPRFGPAMPINELARADKQGNPWMAPDGTLFFDSGTGDTEIFETRRDDSGTFATPVPRSELTSPNEDTGLVLAAGCTRGVISSTRAGSRGFDLWEIVRSSPTGPFDPPSLTAYTQIDTGQNEFDPFLSGDGLRIYFSQSGVGQALRVATRATQNDAFDPPSPLPGAGTFAVEADPDLSPDELVLVFAANLPLQLFAAVRPSTLDPFGAPFALSALSGGGYDGDPALSPDGCELFWISDRNAGDRDLFHAFVTN